MPVMWSQVCIRAEPKLYLALILVLLWPFTRYALKFLLKRSPLVDFLTSIIWFLGFGEGFMYHRHFSIYIYGINVS